MLTTLETVAQVLVIDDKRKFREQVAEFLAARGHTCLSAEDGMKALAILNKEKVDLVLLDYKIPMWDGIETMILFREKGSYPPVIAYTAEPPGRTQPFEPVMRALGVTTVVRCHDACDELFRVVHRQLDGEKQE